MTGTNLRKLTLMGGLLLMLLAFPIGASAQKVVKPCELRPWLNFAYADYNKLYFGDKLPKTVFICYEEGLLKEHGHYAETRKVGDVFFIHITKDLDGIVDYNRIVILHEMVHVKQWGTLERKDCPLGWCSQDIHGPAFQKEMRRLALEGAFDELW